MDDTVAVIDDGWWDILRGAVAASSELYPFETLAMVLLAVIILALGPIWLVLRYRLRAKNIDHKRKFDQIRKGENG